MAKDKNHVIQSDQRQSETMSEDEIDNNLMESFPASDPPSWTLGIDHQGETHSEEDGSLDGSQSE